MKDLHFKTADLCDQYTHEITPCNPVFRSFGQVSRCYGPVETLSIHQDNSLVIECLKESGVGRVLVIDVTSDVPCAIVGDRLATLANTNGWAGVLVHGYVRDIEELRQIPVAIWALGTFPRRGTPGPRGSRGDTLNFAGISVDPGDYVYADNDGIVVSKRVLG